MKALGYNFGTVSPAVLCKLFEDNSVALILSQSPDIRPRKKHINLKYHHIHAYAANYLIPIIPIESSKKTEDMITHPLNEYSFIRHRRSIMGWYVLQ